MPQGEFDGIPASILSSLDSLSSYAFVLSGNSNEVENLVLSTCVKALAQESHFRASTNHKAWMLTILRSEWSNRRRKISTGSFFHLQEEFPVTGFPEIQKKPEQSHELRKLRQDLFHLPEIHREVIFLHDVEGLPAGTTGFVLECPVNTMIARLQNGRTELRKIFARNLIPHMLSTASPTLLEEEALVNHLQSLGDLHPASCELRAKVTALLESRNRKAGPLVRLRVYRGSSNSFPFLNFKIHIGWRKKR